MYQNINEINLQINTRIIESAILAALMISIFFFIVLYMYTGRILKICEYYTNNFNATNNIKNSSLINHKDRK